MQCSSIIRSKPGWFDKMGDADIVARWTQEARVAQGLTEAQVRYVLAELRHYAALRDGRTGIGGVRRRRGMAVGRTGRRRAHIPAAQGGSGSGTGPRSRVGLASRIRRSGTGPGSSLAVLPGERGERGTPAGFGRNPTDRYSKCGFELPAAGRHRRQPLRDSRRRRPTSMPRCSPSTKERKVRLYGGFEDWAGDCIFDEAGLDVLRARLAAWHAAGGKAMRGSFAIKEAA